jgi:hypothetical protein
LPDRAQLRTHPRKAVGPDQPLPAGVRGQRWSRTGTPTGLAFRQVGGHFRKPGQRDAFPAPVEALHHRVGAAPGEAHLPVHPVAVVGVAQRTVEAAAGNVGPVDQPKARRACTGKSAPRVRCRKWLNSRVTRCQSAISVPGFELVQHFGAQARGRRATRRPRSTRRTRPRQDRGGVVPVGVEQRRFPHGFWRRGPELARRDHRLVRKG